MNKISIKDIIKVKVTGIQEYGAFVESYNGYVGLIHISEISYGFVRNISDFLRVGESIYAEVIDIDDDNMHVKLSIKDIDYRNDGSRIRRMAETKNGFTPLKQNLDRWITEKIKEITDQMV